MTPTNLPSFTTGPPWYVLMNCCTFTSVRFKSCSSVIGSLVMNSSTRLYGHEIEASSLMSGYSDVLRPPSRWSFPLSSLEAFTLLAYFLMGGRARCWYRRKWLARARDDGVGTERIDMFVWLDCDACERARTANFLWSIFQIRRRYKKFLLDFSIFKITNRASYPWLQR